MEKSILFTLFGIISIAIGIYQFLDSNLLYGSLSAIYALVFFVYVYFNIKKDKI